MGSALSTAPWMQLSGQLTAAVDRDFELAALPLLRAFWPGLVRPRGMGKMDRAGIDLVAYGTEDAIEAVVQCKGLFAAEGIEDGQVPAIEASIEAFYKSPLKTHDYVLLHNRDGRNRVAAARVDQALATLVTAGKAQRVRQWDRHTFLQALARRLRELVAERVREQSDATLREMEGLFTFGRKFIPNVPIKERELVITRGVGSRMRNVRLSRLAGNIAELLGGMKGRDWTLLIGLFGAGKTTAALHAAALHPDKVLYVYGGSIEPQGDTGGTNMLMSRILETLSVFADFEDQERAIFLRLGGPVLRSLLSANNANEVLIIDALDENKRLSSPAEITVFASSLAELNCPIIITTRQEHFRATFGNYEHLFEELSTKRGREWSIRLVELESWMKSQVVEFIEAACAEAPNNPGLQVLARDVARDRQNAWGPDLLRHPLFLRMVVELAAEGEVPQQSQAVTLARWTRAKLKRDLRANRALPVEVRDRDAFLEEMEQLMTQVAARMVQREDSEIALTDSLMSDEVLTLAQTILKVDRLELSTALAVTLLMPASVRFLKTVPIRFIHRVFQEYYLALHLSRTGEDSSRYPETVKRLVKELKAPTSLAMVDPTVPTRN
jgi:hypothetical protein